MPNVVLSSCCYNLIYSATNWSYSTTVGSGFLITDDSNIIDGCYTIVSGVTGNTVSFDGTAVGNTPCESSCSAYCYSNVFCINTNLPSYSGYDGNYYFNGSYNGKVYYTGGTSVRYLYYNSLNWCLSTSLGGTCDFFGPNPTFSEYPDLDETIMSNGVCVPTPTPYDPCSI